MWHHRTYWLTGQHECGWQFVVCSEIKEHISDAMQHDNNGNAEDTDDEYATFADTDLGIGTGRIITGLKFYNNSLRGSLPSELAALEYLHVVDLGYNRLEGTLSESMFRQFPYLNELYLNSNNFVGTIPPGMVDGLSRLKVLAMANNLLKGALPADLFRDLSSLQRLNLEGNQLSGRLPDVFGSLEWLQEVRLGQNRFDGNIPSSLFSGRGRQSSLLTKCDLSGNLLQGELPRNPNLPYLKFIYLQDNRLSGTISPSLLCGSSDSLLDVRLSNNSFVGRFPKIDCTMKELELLSMASNALTGNLHSSLGILLPSLREIHLYENQLSSTIPSSLFQAPKNLTAVLIGNNRLTGSITSEMVGNAPNLTHLYVNSNLLSGNLGSFSMTNGLSSLKKLRLE